MSIERKLIGTVDASSGPAVYVEDVFSTYLFGGTYADQTITNGIDLATNGGLVWCKSRSSAFNNYLIDTIRGINKPLFSDSTGAQSDIANSITSFNTSGFTLGSSGGINGAATNVSWTFRKQAKFFDVVTYTGDGTSNRSIAHSLGSVPGMIIVKRTDSTGNWVTYHRSFNENLYLNSTGGAGTIGGLFQISGNSTNTNIVLGSNGSETNISGGTYVAYLFAHDAGGFGPAGTDSVVACGSYTGGSTSVNLGWEPQFLLIKNATSTAPWMIFDNMRGLGVSGQVPNALYANSSGYENYEYTGIPWVGINATGFNPPSGGFGYTNQSGQTYIYLAIRRGPMKTPTDATKVFAPVKQNFDGLVNTGFVTDLIFGVQWTGSNNWRWLDRLRGGSASLSSNSISSEASEAYWKFDGNSGVTLSSGTTVPDWIWYNFRRSPGFFDVVCYTGTGSQQTILHSLGAVPELIFLKRRSAADDWYVYDKFAGGTGFQFMNLNRSDGRNGNYTGSWAVFGNTAPTSSAFYVNDNFNSMSDTGATHVAYLFATCAGVSKCGSYAGNGSSQTIDCGFASGARFVLIKRTDSTGDWYVWDSSRGIVSGNDPRLSLNTTAAEVTTDDSIDPASSGFIVNQLSATNINVSSATYIYLAIA